MNPLKIGPTGCAETSIINYHYSLRNDPEEPFSSTRPFGNGISAHRAKRVTLDDLCLRLAMPVIRGPKFWL